MKFMEIKQAEFHCLTLPTKKHKPAHSRFNINHVLICFLLVINVIVLLLNSIIFNTFTFPILPKPGLHKALS